MKTKLIVVARYNENIEWVDKLNCEYLIYNKGGHVNKNYIPIPNDGRETETFLRYIKDNYQNLPDIVGFVQGNPFDHCPDAIELINNFDNFYEVKILAKDIVTIDTDYYYGAYPFLKDFFIKQFIPLISDNNSWEFGAGANYILDSKFIKSKPHKWWEDLYNLLDYFLKKDQYHNYELPHAFERLWILIWKKIC